MLTNQLSATTRELSDEEARVLVANTLRVAAALVAVSPDAAGEDVQ